MFAKKLLKISIAAAVCSSSAVFAEAQVTGKITHESASFYEDGALIGNNTSTGGAPTNISHGDDSFKSETSARIYIDGQIDELKEGATYHVELQAYSNGDAIDTFDGNESYTQRDALREAYVDTDYDDWLVRAGKQQVVWGTADGIKLLDAINPTDYSELVQNSPEDSRIPVWMINADKQTEDGGNFQVVISQPKANFIPGMSNSSATAARTHTNGDKGHPFIMKGVDTITGRTNGFLNIAPDIGAVASVFGSGFGALDDRMFRWSTVGEFFNNQVAAFTAGANCNGTSPATSAPTSAACMGGFVTNAGATTNVNNATEIDNNKTAADTSSYSVSVNEAGANPNSAFAYMTDATFGTFQYFSGLKSRYVVDHDTDSPNINLRYKNTTDDGVNYSFNFMNRYDSNPYVYTQFEDPSSGAKLAVTTQSSVLADITDSLVGAGNSAATIGANAATSGRVYRTVRLPTGYGCIAATGDPTTCASTNPATLAFYEKLNKVNSIGASMDSTIETEAFGPVVFRAEGLYTVDEMMPQIDRNKLSYGDLPGALKMVESDTFKYVLGADITVDTNMLVSGQFIQMINLDYKDDRTDADGNACGIKVNCGVYTGDMAAMHLTNGLQKAEEMKEFYSLYLSKPFGESGQHRWNNIYMFEENDGNWNRFDVEYTIDDNTQLTAEVNSYWGDVNTQFGQMKDSSNVQVGVKYTF